MLANRHAAINKREMKKYFLRFARICIIFFEECSFQRNKAKGKDCSDCLDSKFDGIMIPNNMHSIDPLDPLSNCKNLVRGGSRFAQPCTELSIKCFSRKILCIL